MERNSSSSDSSYAVHVKDEHECLFNQEVLKTEIIVEVEHIKEEVDWDSCESEALEPSDLFPDHVVKDELELGPEGPQPADIAFTLAQALAVKGPKVNDCVVKLERIEDAQRPGTANVTHPNTRQSLTSHAANNTELADEYSDTDTEKEYYVCAICNWRFKLISRLKEHALVHIHVSMEEESVEVVLSAEPADDRGSDLFDHDYAKSESPLPEVSAFECGTCNKKYTELRQLKRHTRTHLRVKPYTISTGDVSAPAETITVTDSEEEIDVVSLGPKIPLAITCESPPPVRFRYPRARHTRHRKCFPSAAAVGTPAPRRGLRARKRRRVHSDSDSEKHEHTHKDRIGKNDMERLRRYCLKKLFDELREQIPKIKDKKTAPKIRIIKEATALCNELREEQKRLGKQQHKLMTEFRKLRTKANRVSL